MQLDRVNSGGRLTEAAATAPEVDEQARHHWYQKLAGLLFVLLCFELGVFLIAFPWSQHWDVNYFGLLAPWWRDVWLSPYFRGAVSGVGIINVYVSFLEVFRLRRFSSEAR
jgi:hypothetical protein